MRRFVRYLAIRRRTAEKRGYEFSSRDVACHVTLRLGVIHAMEGLIPRFQRAVCD